MNITLIGMAGAGKSYLGKKLADKFGLTQIDGDDLLAAKFGKPIQKILDEVGEEKYLEHEANLCIEATDGKDGLLITPGGSIIYSKHGIEHLSGISTVVHVRVPYETIESRLNGLPPRAIIGLGRKTLRELYDERLPLYEHYADFTIDVLNSDLDALFAQMDERRKSTH